MSTISVETKKVTDLTSVTSLKDTDLLPVHDGTSLKSTTYGTILSDIIADNGEAHNRVFRGKCLGTKLTDEQYAEIQAGTFRDLYIGDYWTINGVDWMIVHFDYFLKIYDANVSKHHVTIMPKNPFAFNAPLKTNDSNTWYGQFGDTCLMKEGQYNYSTVYANVVTPCINAFSDSKILTFTLKYMSSTNKTLSASSTKNLKVTIPSLSQYIGGGLNLYQTESNETVLGHMYSGLMIPPGNCYTRQFAYYVFSKGEWTDTEGNLCAGTWTQSVATPNFFWMYRPGDGAFRTHPPNPEWSGWEGCNFQPYFNVG